MARIYSDTFLLYSSSNVSTEDVSPTTLLNLGCKSADMGGGRGGELFQGLFSKGMEGSIEKGRRVLSIMVCTLF